MSEIIGLNIKGKQIIEGILCRCYKKNIEFRNYLNRGCHIK